MSATSIIFQKPASFKGGIEKKIVIPVRYLGYVRVLLWVWAAVWGVIEVALGWGLIRMLTASPPTPSDSILGISLLLGAFTIAGGFIAWRLVWVTKGKEILELTPEHLILRREPAGGKCEEFERGQIRNLHIGSYAGRLIYPSWGRRFVGKEEYFIAFDYDGKSQEIARGMRRKDAEHVVEQLAAARS